MSDKKPMTRGKLIAAYLQIRDKKAELAKRHKEEMAPYNQALNRIETELMKSMSQEDLSNLKTEEGTAYITTRSAAKIADWDEFIRFVLSYGAVEFLERRVSKEAVEAWLEEHESLPPGVSITREQTVNIRKS